MKQKDYLKIESIKIKHELLIKKGTGIDGPHQILSFGFAMERWRNSNQFYKLIFNDLLKENINNNSTRDLTENLNISGEEVKFQMKNHSSLDIRAEDFHENFHFQIYIGWKSSSKNKNLFWYCLMDILITN